MDDDKPQTPAGDVMEDAAPSFDERPGQDAPRDQAIAPTAQDRALAFVIGSL